LTSELEAPGSRRAGRASTILGAGAEVRTRGEAIWVTQSVVHASEVYSTLNAEGEESKSSRYRSLWLRHSLS
jgi:hypothetical protein